MEECLRCEAPFQRVYRIVTTGVEFGGVFLAEGQSVMLLLGAGNRDESAFPDPETFCSERTSNRHLAFGAGAHFCLGADVSCLEAPIAFQDFLQRFPKFQLMVETPKWTDGIVRSIKALPLNLN